ncbi:hypothetical protein ACGF8B_09805 [Streptomyces sp. NPDC047917]|uniref:hypothetical protein n=1 Tax=Streptomyces sp. NPDC047917 TaxID=3365491 RepID=UPI0037174072
MTDRASRPDVPALSGSAVPAAWTRIDAWLRTHVPESYELLAPPADPVAVEAAQVGMGVRFPADLPASPARHDGLRGWTTVLPVRPLLPVAGIVSHREMCVGANEDLEEGGAPGIEGEPWWHRQWIPWAESDGDSRIIDMGQGPQQGGPGMMYHDRGGVFEDAWPCLAAYLEEVADVLENGGVVGGYWAPFLAADAEPWWDAEGAEEMDGEPLTPAPLRPPADRGPAAGRAGPPGMWTARV